MQEDAENRTGPAGKGEARVPRAPATRQRDGRFKKRSRADLRCRARRSLYKPREPKQTEASKETAVVGPDSSLHKETQPEVELKKDDLMSPSAAGLKPESSESHLSPETSALHSKSEDVSLPAANRIPGLPQENSVREPKEQKRRCFEEAASASFPEKKPRLEDRQSFRNTIESVHPEKPQPTKEEPKVPPIRVGKKIGAACCLRAVVLSSIQTLLQCQAVSCSEQKGEGSIGRAGATVHCLRQRTENHSKVFAREHRVTLTLPSEFASFLWIQKSPFLKLAGLLQKRRLSHMLYTVYCLSFFPFGQS